MTIGSDEFDKRIHDLAERESECDSLFEEIKKGNGEKSLRYLAVRNSCKELRKEILKNAMSAGLPKERIKTKINEARNKPTSRNVKQT